MTLGQWIKWANELNDGKVTVDMDDSFAYGYVISLTPGMIAAACQIEGLNFRGVYSSTVVKDRICLFWSIAKVPI